MHQPVQDGVGHSGVGNDFVPLVDGKLAGDEGGALALAVVEDFQQIAILFADHLGNAQVIDNEQRRPSELLEQGQEMKEVIHLDKVYYFHFYFTTTTLAPPLGWHTKVLLFILDSLKPAAIESATWFPFLLVFKNEIIDGPAPLIVTARAPDFNALLLTASYPGIKCFLAGSTMTSSTPFAIICISFKINPATIVLALDTLRMTLFSGTSFGNTLLATSVFLLDTFIVGIAITRTRSLGGSSLINSSSGIVRTITKPPSTAPETLS